MSVLHHAPMSGRKDDADKLRYDLLPPDALEGVVRIFTYGAGKYADRNWEGGIAYGRLFAAVMRHLWSWWRGKDVDEESGLSHLDHAMCGVMMLSAFEKRGKAGLDDRPIHHAGIEKNGRE